MGLSALFPIGQLLTASRVFLLPLLLALLVACGTTAKVTPIPALSPQPTGASIPAGAPTSSVAPSGPAGPTVLSAAEAQGIIHPGTKAAIDDLTLILGRDADRIGIVKAAQATWPDARLGCPQPGFFYAQVLATGIWLVLSHQGKEFDYRTAGSTALLCSQPETVEPLDQETLDGVWSRLADLPTARSEVAVADLSGKIYVLGGFGSGATANEEYDPVTNTWRRRSPIPRGVDHAAAVGLEDTIYLIGGFDGRWGALDNVWAYDPETDA